MADEVALIKAAKNKGRSASVCFSSRNDRCNEMTSISPPGTPSATSGPKQTRRPASRSQSARITGGKSVRRQLPPTDIEVPDSPHSLKSGINNSKLQDFSGSGTSSPVSFRRKGSARRVNSVHHFHNQRKSAAFLDIPKTPQTNSNNQEIDENSYRLRSFSFTTKGLVNRGDSFRRRHSRSNSVFPSACDVAINHQQHHKEVPDKIIKKPIANSSSEISINTYNVSVIGATGVGKTSLISQFMTSECINPYDRDRAFNSAPTGKTAW